MNPRNFFAELKRRNVIRMAGLYLVGAWLLIQVASTMLPAFDVPGWVLRALIITLALGFIPALIFSWVFELTPQGLKRDEDVAPEQSIAPQTARRMDRMIIVVLVLALGYFAFDKWVLAPRREAAASHSALVPAEVTSTASAKSIAVLPFDNLSSDKENAYFAEGIQDEILTRLAKIAALKVISRTSTQKYKSAPDNLREVGKQLGVANLLEGSVQKVANAVHVNVQLIRAATDEHLWAESYNRKLDDIFGVEGEVATAIADQLKAKLTGGEKESLAAKPTSNPQAYDAYLRGLAFEGRADALVPNILNSIAAFEEATRLDPDFALAWSHLARQQSFVFNLSDQSPHRRDEARMALENAMKLAPQSPETQLAEGFYHYWVKRDYETAKTRFHAVRARYPNDPWPPYALAAIARRQGQWEESRRLFAQALELDPQNVFLLIDATLDDISMRDAASAQKHLARARDLSPGNSAIAALQADSMQLSGDVAGAQAVLDQMQPGQDDLNFAVAFVTNAALSRKFGPAIAMLKAQLENPKGVGLDLGWFENSLGDMQRLSGDTGAAAASYGKARAALEAGLRDQPDSPNLVSQLGWAYAGLGDKANALQYARKAITLLPASKDALVGPGYEETLARIEARFGDKESAITALQHLLVTYYSGPPVTPAQLRLDPDWDNLRDDPRFQKLCIDKQQKDGE